MIKELFPIFTGSNLVYLDNASTTQKPDSIIEAMGLYYKNSNANTSRGAYKLSIESTEIYENARVKVKNFINAKLPEEIIFTKNTTESLNIIAYTYGLNNLSKDDEVAILISEHHANLLPWQYICKVTGAKLVYLYFNENFEFTWEEIENKIGKKTKIVACASISNALGIVNPIEKIIKRAHQFGAVVVIDAAQSVSHKKTDVLNLDADFLAFSSHKMYGPMGMGVLYGKKELLQKMPPFLYGGDMVEYVYEDSVTFNTLPNKFEGGTQNVAGAVGLAEAISFIENIGFDEIEEHYKTLFNYAVDKLNDIPYVSIIGNSNPNRSGILSLVVDGVHPHDLSSILDSKNICIRAGNHCAQPLLRRIEINSTARVSFGIYNTTDDIDSLIDGIKYAKELFLNGHK